MNVCGDPLSHIETYSVGLLANLKNAQHRVLDIWFLHRFSWPEELIQRYTDYIEAQVDQFDLYMDVLREEIWKRLFTKR